MFGIVMVCWGMELLGVVGWEGWEVWGVVVVWGAGWAEGVGWFGVGVRGPTTASLNDTATTEMDTF
eukprot:COSAG01_NODE_56857_length_316_cov_0.391705_1_plen_66_part_00